MNDTDYVKIELDSSNSVTVHLHGATIISWISSAKERLFVSKNAIFDNKKAIRGGIPVVFPQFGPWDNNRPQHGFARTKRWKAELKTQTEESTHLTLTLSDDDETRQLWNYKFDLMYEIVLKRTSLETILTVMNKDEREFDFTCLLHTYIRTNSINDVVVHDLEGVSYIDKVDNAAEKVEEHDELKITSEVDRVYKSVEDSILLDLGSDEQIMVVKQNFHDLVVWNPWIEKAQKLADFGDEEYKEMICIEPGCVNNRVVLKPGEKFTGHQELLVVLRERI